jgi:DNA (cytosine-5)-methyltransferase 1
LKLEKYKKMEILVLYAGVGGTMNLVDDTIHEITNIELNPEIAKVLQDRKPNQKVIVADAHEYLRLHADEYDFIQSSRPCQSHTAMMKFTRHKLKRYPDFGLYEEIVFLQNFYKGLWYVENVKPYYEPLIKPNQVIGRHLFWSNFPIHPMPDYPRSPKNMINEATVSGKQLMMEWLGIHYEKNIYYDGNHCPAQVLRNCMHPLIGKHIFECAESFVNKKIA